MSGLPLRPRMFLHVMSIAHPGRPIFLPLLLAAACHGTGEELADTSAAITRSSITDPTSGLTFDIHDEPADDEACPSDRWVGEASTALTCPDPATSSNGTWTKAKLFSPINGYPVPTALRKYCLYQWVSATGSAPEPNKLPRDVHDTYQKWLARDCRVVAPQGSPLADDNWQELEDTFFRLANRMTSFPIAAPLSPVRVDVVDTSTTNGQSGAEGSGRSLHGRSVGLVIEKLTCPGATSCAAEISHSLAMPLYKDAATQKILRDTTGGGYFGTFSDLSTAIFGAVARWQMLSPSEHLVMNLSLGWDPAYDGMITTSFTALPAPIRSIYVAIGHAVCEGAIVVAATGNHSGGPTPSAGPILPAAWETRPAPTAAQCNFFSDSPVSILPTGAVSGPIYRPFLYSATGLTPKDTALANARTNARARLAAPASHVTVEDPTHTYSEIETGSSMAAAVVSAAAAILWSYHDGLAPSEIMELVYDGGVALSADATYCAGSGNCDPVARTSICGAVQEGCSRVASNTCPARPILCSYRAPGTPYSADPPDFNAYTYDFDVDASDDYSWDVGSPCQAELYSADSNGPKNPCPARQYYAAGRAPWTEPQPGADPCPDCWCSGTKVVLDIDREFVGTLRSPVLSIQTPQLEMKIIDLSVQIPELRPGDSVTVENLPYSCTGTNLATIEFLVDDKYSVKSQLLVDE